MRFDEFFGLDKHTAGAAARVIYLALMRGNDLYNHFDDRGRSIELPTLLSFSVSELAEEIFVYLAQYITGFLFSPEANLRDEINQLTQPARFKLRAGKAFIQDIL